jgi:hypothetical protein
LLYLNITLYIYPSLVDNKRFNSSVELNPVLAKIQFSNIFDEVILQFTFRPGVKVKIAIDIEVQMIISMKHCNVQ